MKLIDWVIIFGIVATVLVVIFFIIVFIYDKYSDHKDINAPLTAEEKVIMGNIHEQVMNG